MVYTGDPRDKERRDPFSAFGRWEKVIPEGAREYWRQNLGGNWPGARQDPGNVVKLIDIDVPEFHEDTGPLLPV